MSATRRSRRTSHPHTTTHHFLIPSCPTTPSDRRSSAPRFPLRCPYTNTVVHPGKHAGGCVRASGWAGWRAARGVSGCCRTAIACLAEDVPVVRARYPRPRLKFYPWLTCMEWLGLAYGHVAGFRRITLLVAPLGLLQRKPNIIHPVAAAYELLRNTGYADVDEPHGQDLSHRLLDPQLLRAQYTVPLS
ncbi:hypothetical protein BDW22DRAFT_1470289 [Trametopsis cervina]|nr:hypothetical protein BDW22DRAFT_1470289 [Trametopsis cervina]